jgi:hypothetical protein
MQRDAMFHLDKSGGADCSTGIPNILMDFRDSSNKSWETLGEKGCKVCVCGQLGEREREGKEGFAQTGLDGGDRITGFLLSPVAAFGLALWLVELDF